MKKGVRTLFLAVTLMLMGICATAQDCSWLAGREHPRLFLDGDGFSELSRRVSAREERDSLLLALHDLIMSRAETIGLEEETVEYSFDESGKRLLHRSRQALTRIWLCSYAYRITSDQRFLDHARRDMETVCSFPDWNASRHFLDAAEMAAAVGIGYDWLYSSLPESTKAMAFDALNRHAFLPAANEDIAGFYFSEGNWNQVCNAGLVAGAIATCEVSDTTAQRIITDAVVSNRRAMRSIYSPDGAYAEGPGYWSYGNIFQAMLLSELQTAFGSDFGLGDMEGFAMTPSYRQACSRPGGRVFNYSDNIEEDRPAYPMWYFAARYRDLSYINSEWKYLKGGLYEEPEEIRLLPMLIPYVMALPSGSSSASTSSMYVGRGDVPVIMVHHDASGHYLGLKGGSPSASHAHMDGGSFVYDADGLCWAMDLPRQDYVHVENMARDAGGDFWDMAQSSLRWKFLRLNNRAHNTLTVNDRDFNVKGSAELLSPVDSAGWLGGVLDLTSLYDSQVAKATRKVVISPDGTLVIEDRITALDTLDADVRWTMMTPADVNVRADGIELTQADKALSLKTRSSCPLEYHEWSADPRDYISPFADKEAALSGAHSCGFCAKVRGGTTETFVTIVSKN